MTTPIRIQLFLKVERFLTIVFSFGEKDQIHLHKNNKKKPKLTRLKKLVTS
jgi:hypothetical protein